MKRTRRPPTEETRRRLRESHTGLKFTDEHRRNISIAAKSKKPQFFSEATRKKMSASRIKYWAGKRSEGTSAQNRRDRIYFSAQIASKVFERDDYTCQICFARGVLLHADHIKSWKDYPELRFEIPNCRTLCRPCHYFVTFKRQMPPNSKWGLGSAKVALTHILSNKPLINEET